MTKIKENIIAILVLSGTLLLLLYSSEPNVHPDSNRYLSGSLHDPPLYSTLIKIITILFGSLQFVIIFQTLLISLGIIFLIKSFESTVDLEIGIKIIISIFLFLPIIQFYNNLLTEPISYALSLFFVSFVIKLIYNFNYKNLIWTSILIVALLVTRNQFMFLYPVILIVYIGILIIDNSKKKSWLIISFISIFLIHNTIINLNKTINEEDFKNNYLEKNYTGVYFFTYIDSIYISSVEDIKLFENQKLRITLKEIFKEMDKRKSLAKYYNGRGHFGLSLKNIRNYSKPLLEDLSNKENSLISIKKNISTKLIKANFGKYIKHIFKKFYDSTWLFIFVPLFLLMAAAISFNKYKSHFSLLTIFLSLFALGNHSVIYLFGRVQPRYFIYSDFILLIFIFIIFFSLLTNKKEKIFR